MTTENSESGNTLDEQFVDENNVCNGQKFQWPSISDLNTRIRKLITSFQRKLKKDEVKSLQKIKRLEKKVKVEQIVRDRERQKLEVHQMRWSKKEECDFYRTVSTFGVLFDR